jgi:hypothetical protein
MSFTGHNEVFRSPYSGNYFVSLEDIAEFGLFLAEHISHFKNVGIGRTCYLCSTTSEEHICLMEDKVTSMILEKIKKAKYCPIIFTPDILQVDPLTFVVGCVKEDDSPMEQFLKFIPNTGHKTQVLVEAVTTTVETLSIDTVDCRGQSYVSPVNISSSYNGHQAKIKRNCPKADSILCAAHSLNMLVTCAESCEEACWFFAPLQELCSFFAEST